MRRNGPWPDRLGAPQTRGAMFAAHDLTPPSVVDTTNIPMSRTGHADQVPDNATVTVDPMQFGEFQVINLVIDTNDQIVLQRPAGRRIFLKIVNTSAIGNLYVAYGQAATQQSSESYPPNGGFLLDRVVAQNEIHISGSQAGMSCTVTYCNKDLKV